MVPLPLHLVPGHVDLPVGAGVNDPARVEPVPTRDRFEVHAAQILGDEADRIRRFAEAIQLGVTAVSPGPSPQIPQTCVSVGAMPALTS